MIVVQQIYPEGPLYDQAAALREQVLLEPIGLTVGRYLDTYPEFENDADHFVAVLRHPTGPRTVGTAALFPHRPQPGCGRLAQLAVHPQRRREGIGRALVAAVEHRAFGELGLTELIAHAQLQAVAFYDALGWHVDSEIFEEAGLEHRRVALRQPI